MKRSKLFLWILLSLSSCGYRWESEKATVSVPFVVGDDDGRLTTEIIHALSSSNFAQVVSKGGQYVLRATIVDAAVEPVGFRVDPQQIKGEVRNTLLPIEGRKTITLEMTICRGEEVAFGPYTLKASSDYDYFDGDSLQDLTFTTPAGTLTTVLPFSLGQLEPSEAAEEATLKPLYRRLAQKIVDVLSSEW